MKYKGAECKIEHLAIGIKGQNMKRWCLMGIAIGLVSLACYGCFNKKPLYSGIGIGKWEISFNGQKKYKFDFDKENFQTNHNCEICCSGTIDSWKIEDEVLSGTTSCDTIVVSYSGNSDKNTCKGKYKIYTITGEFLRGGEFQGQKM